MEEKLQHFLDNAFAPYGNFPGKTDIIKELLANLVEKYDDQKAQGKTDEEAFKATTESFGDITEIMGQLPHSQAVGTSAPEDKSNFKKTFKEAFKQAKAHIGVSNLPQLAWTRLISAVQA